MEITEKESVIIFHVPTTFSKEIYCRDRKRCILYLHVKESVADRTWINEISNKKHLVLSQSCY